MHQHLHDCDRKLELLRLMARHSDAEHHGDPRELDKQDPLWRVDSFPGKQVPPVLRSDSKLDLLLLREPVRRDDFDHGLALGDSDNYPKAV